MQGIKTLVYHLDKNDNMDLDFEKMIRLEIERLLHSGHKDTLNVIDYDKYFSGIVGVDRYKKSITFIKKEQEAQCETQPLQDS